jgi:hypothetical protein
MIYSNTCLTDSSVPHTTYSADPSQPNGQAGTAAAPYQTCRLAATGTGYESQYVVPCSENWCGGSGK